MKLSNILKGESPFRALKQVSAKSGTEATLSHTAVYPPVNEHDVLQLLIHTVMMNQDIIAQYTGFAEAGRITDPQRPFIYKYPLPYWSAIVTYMMHIKKNRTAIEGQRNAGFILQDDDIEKILLPFKMFLFRQDIVITNAIFNYPFESSPLFSFTFART